jgi:hypothetical protein
MMQWCKQIEACTPKEQIPVVIYRQNGQPWRVTLRLEDFVPLMREKIAGL